MRNRSKRIGKRLIAALLVACMVAGLFPAMTVQAKTDVPEFGDRLEDWDYNQIKGLYDNTVYALNHNEYLEYKSFQSIYIKSKEDEWTNNGIYFEFSYPYNCNAEIQLYKLTGVEIQNGEKQDMFQPVNGGDTITDILNDLNKDADGYMGTLMGLTLNEHVTGEGTGTVHTKGWSINEIEKKLKEFKFSIEDKSKYILDKITIYGYTGRSSEYETLEEYYALKGMGYEEVSGNVLAVETVSDSELAELTELAENNVSIPDEIPEDYYITEKDRYAPQESTQAGRRMTEESEMPNKVIHNYLLWSGFYVNKAGKQMLFDNTEGLYVIVIQPVAFREGDVSSLKELRTYLPFFVGGESNGQGAGKEEIYDFRKEVYRDRMLYITLAIAMGGDPVDLVTGSLEWNYTDISLEGKNSLYFERSYSSMRAENGEILGNGWTHNYNYKLDSFYGTVSITMPNGSRIDFVKEQNGTYSKSLGSAYCLEGTENGYRLLHSQGDSYYFDGSGILTEVRDIYGNVTTLENDGRHITGITNSSGNLQLEYTGDLLTAVTDNVGRTVQYAYTGTDLTAITNPDGEAMTCTYDENHNLMQVNGFTGEQMLQNTYNEKHQVISQTLPDMGTYTYAYDEATRTTTHTAENGLSQTVTYDERYRIVSDSNADGALVYTYDEYNRRLSETDRNGNLIMYTYAGDTTNIETVTYADGSKETYTYNEKNQVTSKVQRDGTVLTFTYDVNGNLISYIDANRNQTLYEYDGQNNCIKKTDSLNHVITYTYDGAGNKLSETDVLGNTSVYTYDAVGRILTETTPEGHTTRYEYTPAGKLTTKTDAIGYQENYTYTGNGFVSSETDKKGNTIGYTYSAMNHVLNTTDREGNTTVYTYDKNGKVETQTDPEGNVTRYTYDFAGRKISETDGNGNTVNYTYDGNGNLTSITDACGNRMQAIYDINNQVQKEIDGRNIEITYEYDSMGRVLKRTDGEGNSVRYGYDSNGNVLSVTNARGNTTKYQYDANNRLISVTDALGQTMTYAYDEMGQCTKSVQTDQAENGMVYDKDGNLIRFTDAAGKEQTYTYDALGRILSVTDALGNTITYSYDANGNLISVTEADGSVITYEYDKEDRLLKETDALGGQNTYTYFKNGWLATETNALGGVISYTYDGAGNITTMTDPMGYKLIYTYDADNRVISIKDQRGSITTYEYDANDNLTAVHNPDGGTETYTYDNNNRISSFTDAEGYTIFYTYDANGNLVQVTDAKGNVTKAEYDALDRRTVTTDALGHSVQLTLDEAGRIVKAVNEDGAVTKYQYDVMGRVTEIKDALGNRRNFTYDAMGNRLSETDENGVTRTATYDSLGNQLTYTDGLGNITSYEYDANGNLTKITAPGGRETTYTYDALNRVIKETDALGHNKDFIYDKNSNIIGVRDENGNTTAYILDANGNITCQIDAMGHKSYFAYDAMNRLVKVTLYSTEKTDIDGKPVQSGEQITLYSYDHRGLLTTQINAAGDGTFYVYDEVGNLVSKTDEEGYVTSYEYDALNRLTLADYNGSKQAAYVYNNTGELIELTDWNGTTVIQRDLLNRIQEVKDHNNRITGYAWDNVGNLTALTYPGNAGTAEFTYDTENHQLTAKDVDGKLFTFTYDEAGNLTGKRYPNGEMERYQYDALNQLVRMDEYNLYGTQKSYTEYTYDEAGNRTGDCNRIPTTPTHNYEYTGNTGTWGGEWNTYTYDALNRLVKEYEQDTALTIQYGYDSLGNKTYEKNSSAEVFYTYNVLNQVVQKEAYNGISTYEYDKRGNRTLETSQYNQENRRTYTWDETNHLVQGTRGPDYGLYTSTYTYNGLGLRVNSTIMGPDYTIYDRDYVIDYTSPERNDLAEYNMGHYQWQGDRLIHELSHLYNSWGQRLETNAVRYTEWSGVQEVTRYIHEDILGSSVYYTSPENGTVVNRHDYTTWGSNTKAPTYNYDPEYRAGEPYFTGHPYDGSLNLYFAENRFYDPETGSFLSRDPMQSGLNWYQYCGGNPVSYVDPLGLVATTIKEDDPFFYKKMEDSGNHGRVQEGLLEKIDRITYDNLDKKKNLTEDLNRLTERKFLTAKYLTYMMLVDPYFTEYEYGQELVMATVANMLIEGEPGLLEGSKKDLKKREYLKLLGKPYANVHDKCVSSGNYKVANTMELIQDLLTIPNISKKKGGYGFGMFQGTFGRAVYILETYTQIYGEQEEELTLGQSLVAEYISFKRELNETIKLNDGRSYNYTLKYIVQGYNESTDERRNAKIMAEIFRKNYEGMSKGEVGDVAVIWYDLLSENGVFNK